VAVRKALPDAFLVFEIYDYMCMFPTEILDGWKFDAGEVEENCCAEALMGLEADFIFDKTPGPQWQEVTGRLVTAPRQPYYPRMLDNTLAEADPSTRLREGPLRIMCAGTIPEFKYYRPGLGFSDSVFQDIISPLQLLAADPGLRVDIFNSGHNPGSEGSEREYAGYRGFCDARRIHYHPFLPFEQLVARMPDFDFGIFLFAPTDMIIDFPLMESLPNRFMGYVTGDLPAIVNKEMRYIASLVERFNAGIAVGAEELEDLPRRILEADLEAMRKGMRALHAHMIEHNRKAILTFQAAFRKGLARTGA
jgi:hypothetical protein